MSREAHIVTWDKKRKDPTSHPTKDVMTIAEENLGRSVEEVLGHPANMSFCADCQRVWAGMPTPDKYQLRVRYVRTKSRISTTP